VPTMLLKHVRLTPCP